MFNRILHTDIMEEVINEVEVYHPHSTLGPALKNEFTNEAILLKCLAKSMAYHLNKIMKDKES